MRKRKSLSLRSLLLRLGGGSVMIPSGKADAARFLPWFVLIGLALLYSATVVSFPWPADSAEFVVAAATLGIAHPTGYPLYVILGHLVLSFSGAANTALVINALSAVYLLTALGILVAMLRRLGISPVSTAGVVALLGTTHTLWENGTLAEVYTLHILMVVLVMGAMLRVQEDHVLGVRLLLPWFLAGLCLGNHMTSALLVPGLVFWKVTQSIEVPGPRRFKWVLPAAAMYLVGALIITLPILLDRPTALNYISQYALEYPQPRLETPLGRFGWLLTGSQYGAIDGVAREMLSFNFFSLMASVAKRVLVHAPVLVIGGCIGLATALRGYARSDVKFGLALFAAFTILLNFLYFSGYSHVYFEPAFFALSFVLLGIGTAFAAHGPGRLRQVAQIAIFAMALVNITTGLPDMLRRDGVIYINESRRLLASVEPDAVVFSTWGNSTLFWYAQWIDGINPGVVIANAHSSNWLPMAAQYDNPQDETHDFNS